ncbi:hypothetical protein [Isoptericola sediminis]|uniref:Uncharacterized protein n=1 Tax=Isoptericola sediminis TaxID=2733572 RepID=A0A849K7G4_9MICO|nr:hypothetical protein [Isoptericola sediminis]NNU27969.1 hypothetical protein [Isoptericola sediminis]
MPTQATARWTYRPLSEAQISALATLLFGDEKPTTDTPPATQRRGGGPR